MIKKIRVTNFKVVQDSGLLNFQELTAIIGRNGSGKSSLIEALDWLGTCAFEGAQAATLPFRRARDLINDWNPSDPERCFGITLVFEPQDDSAGADVVYRVEIGTDAKGQHAEIRSESLDAIIRGQREILIRTDPAGGARQFWQATNIEEQLYNILPPSLFRDTIDRLRAQEVEIERLRVQQAEAEKNSQTADSKIAADKITDNKIWSVAENRDRLALADLRATGNRTAAFVLSFLQRLVVLRLNPRTIADFAPAQESLSPRLLDDQGNRLAALLATYDPESLSILVEKLSFILQRADQLMAHEPSGPADRRFFTLIERRGPEEGSDEPPSEAAAPPATIEVPAWTLSEGTRRLTAMLAVLLHNTPPPLVCIEEIENGLDPWTITYLIDELGNAVIDGTQIIITSHSPYLLNLLPLELIMFCNRSLYSVEYSTGDSLPDREIIRQRMGPGDLYANRYFHRSKEDREL